MAREFADEATIRMVEAGDNAHAQDSRLFTKFYTDAVQNEPKSAEAGRPIFDEVTMIQIIVPGQTDVLRREAWEADYIRFPKHYAAFKAGAGETETGTPLKVWPMITIGQVAELNAKGVRTVEQLAGMADIDAQKFMGSLNTLRKQAKDFIEAAKGSAPLTAMRAELEAKDSRIANLEAQMAQVLAHANRAAGIREEPTPVAEALEQMAEEAAAAATPKRRGRPPGSRNAQEAG